MATMLAGPLFCCVMMAIIDYAMHNAVDLLQVRSEMDAGKSALCDGGLAAELVVQRLCVSCVDSHMIEAMVILCNDSHNDLLHHGRCRVH
jgi:hypothetical protein